MRPTLLALLSFLILGTEIHSQTSGNGLVGVYGDIFQGKGTASGVPYDRGLLTAAHDTLPFGTWIRVANFETGRMVDVQVNDRKREDDRLVTVSRAAADAIGLAPNKVAPGSLHVLASAAPLASPVAPAATVPTQGATGRKFRSFAGLFGKEAVAAPALPAPVRYGIPAENYAPPAAAAQGGGLFQKSNRGGGLFSAKPTVPAPTYPSPIGYPASYSPNPPSELIAMNAPVGRPAVSGPVMAPMPAPVTPAGALPPASPSAPYRVQFGAFRHVVSGEQLSSMLDGAGIPTSVYAAPGTGLNVVVTDSGFRSADEAQRWIDYEGARRGWTDRPVVIR